jgi:YVTN family beta-propeller protein
MRGTGLASLKRNGRAARLLRHLLLIWIFLAMPLMASTVRIYVANMAGGPDESIDVIDPTTNKVVQVIQGIELPHGVQFSLDGRWVYISDESENMLDVVDRMTGKTFKKIPLSGRPNNITVAQDGKRVFVAIRVLVGSVQNMPGALDVIDTTSFERVKTIPTKGGIHNTYVTPDGKYVVAGSEEAKNITVIDVRTEQPIWETQFDRGIRPMAFGRASDGSTARIFLQLSGFHGFAAVDFTTHKEVARIQLPDEPRAGGAEGEARIPAPSHGIGVAPDGKTLWVASSPARAVFAYSLPDLKLLGYVSTGVQPDWVTFTPDSKMIYVSNSGDSSVSAIDIRGLKEVARIPVGQSPHRISTLVLP